MFQLHLEQGETPGKVFELPEGECLIGRSSAARIHLSPADISGKHATLTVRGGRVTIRNHGQNGTWVEGRKLKIDESSEVLAGQKIRLGHTQTFRLTRKPADPDEPDSTDPGSATHRAAPPPTNPPPSTQPPSPELTPKPGGHKPTPPSTQPSRKVAPPPPEPDDLDRAMRDAVEKAHSEPWSAGDAAGETQPVHTRPIGPEQLDRLAQLETWKARRRAGILAVVGLVVLIAVFSLGRDRQDNGKLQWADSPLGEGVVAAPGGDFNLVYPRNASSAVRTNQEGCLIETGLGRNREIPLTLSLRSEEANTWALQDGAASLADWLKAHPERNPGTITSRFSGRQNGVRTWAASYTYATPSKERIAGRVTVFSHGRTLFVLTAEIPEPALVRAEDFLFYDYFDFPPEFEDAHWEGQPLTPSSGSPTAALDQVRADLRRVAPLAWAAVERQLRSALSQAVAQNQATLLAEATQLLIELRRQQRRWYSGQYLLVTNARQRGDRDTVGTLAQGCQAVFSDPSDRRYSEVRSWP